PDHEGIFIAPARGGRDAPRVASMGAPGTHPRGLIGAGAVLALALLMLLPCLGRMAALDTTDARYLEVAREMRESGDWIVPRLAGVVHLDKPPLTYWAAAAGYGAFGVSPFAGRVLEQLALAATAVLLFGWARRRIGERPAWVAAGVFLTSGLVFISSRGLNTDLFQLLLLTGALLALFEGSQGRAGPAALGIALLGVSMLVKGPIALLVAVAGLVPFLVLRRSERRLPARGVLLGAALFAALGLPWYATVVWHDPALLRWFAEHQILARVSGGGGGPPPGAPSLSLPVHLVVGILPWTPLVLLSLWRFRPRAGVRMAALDLFLLLWALVPCLLFELFATKLPTYLLPALPALTLVVARALGSGRLEDQAGRTAIAVSIGLLALTALTCAGLLAAGVARGGVVAGWVEAQELEAPIPFALVLAAVGALALRLAALALRREPSWTLPRAVMSAGAVPGLCFSSAGARAP